MNDLTAISMEISASDVKNLRDRTGAGMMDCKKALMESNGDMDKAVEYLRKKGAATAEKRSDRAANEGVVMTNIDNGKGVIIEVNCETDFVARSEDFLSFARTALQTVEQNHPADVDSLLASELNGTAVSETLTDTIGKIGEKIQIRRFATFQSSGILIDYIHPGSKLGVMVELSAESNTDETQQLGKDIAMQVAAMSPIAIDRTSVPGDVQEKEMEIYRQQAREQGKPENILDKIAEGKLNKFFQDYTLLEQSFIRDNAVTVKEHIESVGKSLGQQIRVVRFERFQVGDGS